VNTAVMFSSEKDDWETPQDLFDALNSEFGFSVDVCASNKNAKVTRFWNQDMDSLAIPWVQWAKANDLPPVFWMNPPYGREIGKWIQKAYEESQGGGTVVCLVPSRTDTRWWHDYCMQGEIRFIRGRLKFGGAKNSAPFPSAIVIFRGGTN
jgi:phage N-6-adenine-methyltransferase